jgi:hypothetical protein
MHTRDCGCGTFGLPRFPLEQGRDRSMWIMRTDPTPMALVRITFILVTVP